MKQINKGKLFLEGTRLDQLSAVTVDKLEQWDLADVLPRNLGVFLPGDMTW